MAEPEIKRILKETLAYIEYHRLGPGDRLPSERDLAERMTVGRNTIREALTVLETVRLVERRPNAGFYLRDPAREGSIDAMVLLSDFGIPLSEKQAKDVVEMRRILEVHAIRLACERHSPADIKRLHAILDETEAKIAAGRSIAEQDALFHLGIVEATHNDVFCRMANSFTLMSRVRRTLYFADPARGPRSQAHHRQIVAAIEKGDPMVGVKLMEKHLDGVETFWLDTLGTGRR